MRAVKSSQVVMMSYVIKDELETHTESSKNSLSQNLKNGGLFCLGETINTGYWEEVMADETTCKESLQQFDEVLLYHKKLLGFDYIVIGEHSTFLTLGRDVYKTSWSREWHLATASVTP